MSLSGKRVAVTGASRGIGRAIAEACVAEGMQVVSIARTTDGAVGARTVACDLADSSARAALVPKVLEELGGLDAWVNNAGIARHGPLVTATDDDVRATFELNFFAALDLARAALPALLASQGSLVFVASTLALRPAPGTGAYAASKAALVAMMRTLALEHGPAGVRVNAVAPGVIDTDMVRGRDDLDAVRALHPLGRLGTPEDVAGAVLHLLRAPWTTGTVLAVDGGQLAS
ncbi:MAG: SDR family oxidoreductase [Polyangiales bacterium]